MNSTFGELLASESIDTSIPNAQAWKIRYRSIDLRERDHEVTGIVVAPNSTELDRPIVTWCHGTTGLGDAACPSQQEDPARDISIYFSGESDSQIDYGVPGLSKWIAEGFIVCATDYQGLGTPGVHHYPVAKTNALDALAIARATTQLLKQAGNDLYVFGWSQGGAAAAALAELDERWFGDLHLRRCCAMSPGVIAASSASPGADIAALSDRTIAPSPHLLMTIYGHAAAFEELDVADMLTPLGRELMEQIWNSQPVHHLGDTTSRIFALSGDLMHGNPLTDPSWSKAMLEGSAGFSPPRCEVLVCMDSFRNGSVVPIAWQEHYVAMVEQLGATVTIKRYEHDDHFSLPGSCVGDVIAWMVEPRSSEPS